MITLICGLPNAGKTTYSQRYPDVIHFDDCPMPRREIFEKLVAEADWDVCAEGVCNSRHSRGMFLRAVAHKQEKKVCIWLDTPLEVCIEREQAYRKRHIEMVLQHAKRFEPPTLDEGWDEIIIIRGGEEIAQSVSIES